MKNDNIKIWWDPRLAGEFIVGTMFVAYALSTLGFLVGITISWATLPAAFAVTGAVTYAAKGTISTRAYLFTVVVVAAFAALTALVAALLYDFSYDGNEYHQEIVAALADGWNPLCPDTGPRDLSLWSRHYAKALETLSADIVALFGPIEAGKAVNFWLAAGAALLSFDFIRRRFPAIGRAKAVIITAVAVGNPVAMCQSLTFYIDFAKYFYTLIAIMAIVDIAGHAEARRAAATLFAVTCLAIGTKFNAFFEIGMVYIAAMAWFAIRKRRRTLFATAAIGATALIVGVLLLGYHPYVTNTLSAGHPLYPLMGEGKEDIMTSNTPEQIRDSNRFVNFFLSVATPAVPTVDSRLGGFGPLFALMLIAALFIIGRRRKSLGGVPLYATCWIVASCFFFEQSWWARYITQLWMLVPLSALLAAAYAEGKSWDFKAQTLMWAATALLCLASIAFRSVRLTVYRNAIFTELTGRAVVMTNANEGYRRQLADHRITIADSVAIDSTLRPLPYYGRLSKPDRFPIMYITGRQRTAIVTKLRQSPFKYSETLNELTDTN